MPGGKNSLNSHRLHSRTLANHFAKVSRWVRARPAATPGKETPNACPWDRGLIAGCQFRHSWEDVTGAQGDDGVAKMSERKWQSRAQRGWCRLPGSLGSGAGPQRMYVSCRPRCVSPLAYPPKGLNGGGARASSWCLEAQRGQTWGWSLQGGGGG